MKIVMKDTFTEVDIQFPENFFNLDNNLLFLSERMKIKKGKKLVVNS